MAGVKKPTAMEAFDLNMADAHALVRLAEGFVSKRPRGMRGQLQQRVGEAEQIGSVLWKSAEVPRRLGKLQLTLDEWMFIDKTYGYKRRGLREVVVEPAIRQLSSANPNRVGELLSMLGVTQWTQKVDTERGVKKGDTQQTLDRIRCRRNKIAHEGDRRGRGRVPISVDEVNADLANLESIVAAIEAILPRGPRAATA